MPDTGVFKGHTESKALEIRRCTGIFYVSSFKFLELTVENSDLTLHAPITRD